jgi:hypothetical protein
MQASTYYKVQNSIVPTIVAYTFGLGAKERITGNLSYSLSESGCAERDKCLLQQLPKPKRVPTSALYRSAPINLPWQNTTQSVEAVGTRLLLLMTGLCNINVYYFHLVNIGGRIGNCYQGGL